MPRAVCELDLHKADLAGPAGGPRVVAALVADDRVGELDRNAVGAGVVAIRLDCSAAGRPRRVPPRAAVRKKMRRKQNATDCMSHRSGISLVVEESPANAGAIARKWGATSQIPLLNRKKMLLCSINSAAFRRRGGQAS